MAKFQSKFVFRDLDTKVGMQKLVRIISQLDDSGRKILLDALNSQLSDAKKQQVLTALRSQVAIADVGVRAWLLSGITASYVAGANYGSKALKSIGIRIPAGAPPLAPISVSLLQSAPYLKPHLETVNVLLSSAYADFGSTMTGYLKGADNIISEATKLQIRSSIAQGRLEGTAIADIKRVVKTNLGDSGFTVLLDRGGRSWDLARYSEMVTRTHINKAANEAFINRMSDFEVDIVEVSSHGAQDEACAEEEGQIYSISGDSNNYPPLDGHEPPYHPNCTHNLIPRPDLS